MARVAAAALNGKLRGHRASAATTMALAALLFQIGGETVPAHRLILTTQCEYFERMLGTTDFTEGKTGVVKVSALPFAYMLTC